MKGVLLDISGVIVEGGGALPGAVNAVNRLRAAGLPVRFVTNTTSKPRRVLLETLNALGLTAGPEDLFTPATAACAWMEQQGCVPYLVINPALAEDFADCTKKGPKAVVVGDAGQSLTYDLLNGAFRQLIAGAPFLALAANRTFRDDDGEISLDAGAFVQALEYSSGVAPIILGKPAPGFFAAACASMGCDMTEAAMIGDDAEADIAGALTAGIGRAVLVRTGKYAPGDEARFDPRPTAVADEVAQAVDLLLA